MADMQVSGVVGNVGPIDAVGVPGANTSVGAVAAGAGMAGPAATSAAGSAQAAPGATADPDKVQSAVRNANQSLAAIGTQLVFVFDNQAHHMAVKLLDAQTQKVVQEIPSEAMPAAASALSGDSISGALVDTQA